MADEKAKAKESVKDATPGSPKEPAIDIAKGAADALDTFRRTGKLPTGFVYNNRWPEKVRSVAKAGK